MRGQRLIELPVKFRYSENGQSKEECAVMVQAPGLDQFAVHNKMVAYAAEALRKVQMEEAALLASMGSALDIIMKARAEIDQNAEPVAEPKPESLFDMTTRVMETYAKGLGHEKFPDFMDYLKKVLTNNPKLARVGETKIAIRDESWDDINERGGMEAVSIILAAFADFFLQRASQAGASREQIGNSSRPTSPSGAAVH